MEGKSQPTLSQLEKFARQTRTPLGYLFLTEPPEERLPIPHFRTLGNGHPHRPSPDLLETVYTMERRQEWMREYLIQEGQEPLHFVRSAKLNDKPQNVAKEMHDVLGLEHGWAARQATWTDALRELRSRLEGASILVVVNGIVGNNTHRKLDPAEFRGFVLVDDYAPLVFVNGTDAKAAQMFTLAHELAHLWLGSSAAFDLRELQPADDETERSCNRIAAEFLVPESELRTFWPSARQDPERFQMIARRFKVSELVAARRALDLELIRKTEFHDFYQSYLENERRQTSKQPSGGDFYANQNFRIGRLFAETVVRAAKEGKLLYRDAYQLTGLSGSTFDHYAEKLSFGEAG
ncbi:MAG TPA: ImmA/IrrE family metallo-endopeptidase [Candidatus Binataceae bacterium]|nr:ImmA/IrrE family metallo-endopeptidase [Candidatus Binataceae bacterium]